MSLDKKRFLKSLNTLIKVEDAKVQGFQKQIAEIVDELTILNDQINSIDQTIEKELRFIASGEFVHNNFAIFKESINAQKKKIMHKKEILDAQWLKIHDELMTHVRSQKAYESIQTKTKIEQQELAEKDERKVRDDLMQIRYIQKNMRNDISKVEL